MVYKKELTLYMEFEDEAVQKEIQERHRYDLLAATEKSQRS